MSITLRRVGREAAQTIALTRLRCYGSSDCDLPRFRAMLDDDPRAVDGDFVLVERDGRPVGTATALSYSMHSRRGVVPAQGVAWVGTIKTDRRRHGDNTPGVASRAMREMLEIARERGQVVSALMPFRASFYEHFGYGVVERRAVWTIPLVLLPTTRSDGYRFFEPTDIPAIVDCRTREARQGQCDIEGGQASVRALLDKPLHGSFAVVDSPAPGVVRGFADIASETCDGKTTAVVQRWCADSHDAFMSLLGFLGSLKDQYSFVRIQLPADWPVNLLLRESQLPHRPVDHPAATCSVHTRMQLRILDHKRFLESLTLETPARGKITVEVRECEGHASRLAVQADERRLSVSPSNATPDVSLSDVRWAAVATGAVPASTAARLGQIEVRDDRHLPILDALSVGRLPWSGEYF